MAENGYFSPEYSPTNRVQSRLIPHIWTRAVTCHRSAVSLRRFLYSVEGMAPWHVIGLFVIFLKLKFSLRWVDILILEGCWMPWYFSTQTPCTIIFTFLFHHILQILLPVQSHSVTNQATLFPFVFVVVFSPPAYDAFTAGTPHFSLMLRSLSPTNNILECYLIVHIVSELHSQIRHPARFFALFSNSFFWSPVVWLISPRFFGWNLEGVF